MIGFYGEGGWISSELVLTSSPLSFSSGLKIKQYNVGVWGGSHLEKCFYFNLCITVEVVGGLVKGMVGSRREEGGGW